MAGLLGKMVFRLKFKDDNFFAFCHTLRSSGNLGSFNGWRTYGNLVLICNKQDLIQLDFVSLSGTRKVYVNRLARGDLILFTTGFNNSVNGTPPITTTVYCSRIRTMFAILSSE
jgi:hypothetical protein